MQFFLIFFLIIQEPQKGEHEIGEEIIKGEAELKIRDPKLYVTPEITPFAPLESILVQERYIFDEKLYSTIDALNTPIMYLHSEYLRMPLVSKLMYGSIALFVPRFEKTVSSWELLITNANGEVVRRYAERAQPPSTISWDGRTDDGKMCNIGEVYNYVFNAFDVVGNPTRITGRPYKFNGIVYDENDSKIIAISVDVLFNKNANSLTNEAVIYLDELANLIKENFKKEVVVYSYSEDETLAKSRGNVIVDEIRRRTVLPQEGIKTSARFIPGLEPKYSKIEVIIQ